MASQSTYNSHMTGAETSPTLTPPTVPQVMLMVRHNNPAHHIQALKSKTSHLAAAYRNFGLLFNSLPLSVIYNRHIYAGIREYARTNFTLAVSRELPSMIQILGTLDNTFGLVPAALVDGDVEKAHRLLMFAESLVVEAHQTVLALKDAVEIYCRLKYILVLEGGWPPREGATSRRRKEQMRDAFVMALPGICWEGYPP